MHSCFVDFHRSRRFIGSVLKEAGLMSVSLSELALRALLAAAVMQSFLNLEEGLDGEVPAAELGL